jgi:aldehyde:ferredoxin oxidoreductase
MPFGYNGKILVVDLSAGTWTEDAHDETWYRTYWGGGALASWYMHRLIPKGCDPLSPQNVLVFATSVLCGAPLSGFSRLTAAAKSPLTDAFGESEAGGYLGPELKHAGFDALVLTGKAPKPVYLYINKGEVSLRDAGKLWGMENAPLHDALKQELGEKSIRVASIGPAGERLVRYACIVNELVHVNGRCGLGAVMGSKHLKAVVCLGDEKSISYADPALLKEVGRWHRKAVSEHMPNVNIGKNGTPMHVMTLHNGGMLPTRNWREGTFEHAEAIGLPGYEKILERRHTCHKCSVACKRVVRNISEKRYGGPEFETLAAFGSMCGVGDLDIVCKAHERSNALGLDSISAGSAIAFAMELAEEGLLDKKEIRGFGDGKGMLDLLEKIARREGVGDIMAEGTVRAAAKIGRGAEQFVCAVKGQEPGLHDPRGKTGVGMGFALSPTGADHIEAPHDVAFQGAGVNLVKPLGILEAPKPQETDIDKVRFFIEAQKSWAMNNTLAICNFVVRPIYALTYDKLVEAVKAITGWETSLYELLTGAERSIVLARMFNVREGFGSKDDSLFARLHTPMPAGPLQGKYFDREEFRAALDLYYAMMNWDENGVPRKAKLHALNLGWLAD